MNKEDSYEDGKKRKKKEKRVQNQKIVRVKTQMCLACVCMVVITVCASYFIVTENAGAVVKEKISSLNASLNAQVCLGVEHFLEEIERSCMMVYSDPENYEFNAAKEKEASVRLQTEERIADRLSGIEVLENYADLGIIYQNGEIAGSVSSAEDMQKLYAELEEIVANEPQTGHWKAGTGGDSRKFAYMKRLNEGAILYASFYTAELEELIESAVAGDERMVYIVDGDWNILCSDNGDSEKEERIVREAQQLLQDAHNAAVFDDFWVLAVNECKNQWQVLSVVDAKAMLREEKGMLWLSLLLVLSVLAGSAVSILVTRKITRPLDTMVEGLSERAESDLLTGTLNKKSFEQAVEQALQEEQYGEAMILLLTDVDDFKKINDSYGHINGDKVLAQYGSILSEVFREEIVGRIGGDEFAVLASIPRYEREKQYILKKIEELCRRVEDIKVEDRQVTISIGAALRQYSEGDFKQLYGNADKALYQTKTRGKNGYTIYEET